jgi:hypothetical protein
MSEHECLKEPEIAVLENETCTMKKEIEKMRVHMEESSLRYQELKDAISDIKTELKGDISSIKVWVLSGIAWSLFTVILGILFK